MSEIEYDGEPLDSGPGIWLSVTQHALDDAEPMRAYLSDAFDRMLCDECNAQHAKPLTTVQRVTGWRVITCSRHGDQRQEVAWRAERTERRRREAIDAEMAACPYVACECGYHED